MREYLLVFAVSAAVTFLCTPVARGFAIWIGAVATVRDRDVHAVPTPRLGGLAMLAGVAAGLEVADELPFLSSVSRDWAEPHAVGVASVVICLLGVVDDRWPLDAVTKLAGQVAAAGVMVLLGVQWSFAVNPDSDTTFSLGPETAVPLSIFATVVLVNAMNFIDGLDGLAAGVAAIAAGATFYFAYEVAVINHFSRAAPGALLAAVTAGVCLGFLPHNFNPASLFMGDSGSMLVGLLSAASMISVTGQVAYGGYAGPSRSLPSLIPLAIPLAVLAVPFIDLGLAVIRRTRAGRSPFAADKMHLHHRMLEIGKSHVRAVLIMYFWAALLGFGGVAASFSRQPLPILAAVVGLGLIGLLVLLLVGQRSVRRA
ncbi:MULTISPECIES: MraY family glycosyltransferase [unclassified Frankia]|uniref:MraY family glycosyltransferase n=1 Tax=unclassified Frankia TaxID=2632575 RepID=UPI002AD3075E|nr:MULTISPECIES: MraY family glycosyltransferase [unclassified Frankia]